MAKIRVCPKCKSTVIQRKITDGHQTMIMPSYGCVNCGHSGNDFPEQEIVNSKKQNADSKHK